MKTNSMLLVLVMILLVACNGGSSTISSDTSNNNSGTQTQNPPQTQTPQVTSFAFTSASRILLVEVEDSTSPAASVCQAVGNSNSRHTRMIQVNNNGEISTVNDELDIKNIHRRGKNIMVSLNNSHNGSYLMKVNTETGAYENVDSYPVVGKKTGMNEAIQWNGEDTYYVINHTSGKQMIRKLSADGHIRTVHEFGDEEEIGDYLIHNNKMHFVTKKANHHEIRYMNLNDESSTSTLVSSSQTFAWIKSYPQENDPDLLHAGCESNSDYEILDVIDDSVTDSFSLTGNDWYGNEESDALMSPLEFVETDNTYILHSEDTHKVYQLYPFVTRACLYPMTVVTTDGEKLWMLNEDGDACWVDAVTFAICGGSSSDPVYAGLYNQFMKVAESNGTTIYFTSQDEDGVFVGEQDSSTGTVTGQTIDATSVVQDIVLQ